MNEQPVTTQERTLTVEQIVTVTGIARRTLYYWMRAGRLPFTVVRRTRRLRLSDVPQRHSLPRQKREAA